MKIRTYGQFLNELVKVPVEWELVNGGLIRTQAGRVVSGSLINEPDIWIREYVCPVCAIANVELEPVEQFTTSVSSAIETAGIDVSDGLLRRIINAADGCGTPEDMHLMRMACGLESTK